MGWGQVTCPSEILYRMWSSNGVHSEFKIREVPVFLQEVLVLLQNLSALFYKQIV